MEYRPEPRANITVVLSHRVEGTEEIPNIRAMKREDGIIKVRFRMEDRFVTEEYDGLEWRVEKIHHTEE